MESCDIRQLPLLPGATSFMQALQQMLEQAARLGLWDFLTFTIGGIGGLGALVYFRRRSHDRFSLFPSYQIGTGHSLYPNVIYFSARNLGDLPIVLCRPNFKPSRHLVVADTAHGNLATNDYELKFRPVDSRGVIVQGLSYTTVLLRHRDEVVSYIPISKDYNDQTFASLLAQLDRSMLMRWIGSTWGGPDLGRITFDIVTVSEGRPRVVRIRQKVMRLARESRKYQLGFDPIACAPTTAIALLGPEWPG